MQRTAKETSPVNYILKTHYGLNDEKLQQLREYFYSMVQQRKSPRGSQLQIEAVLKDKFPGIEDYFPIPKWEQRVKNPDKSFSYAFRTKTWHESVESYSKGVTEWAKKHKNVKSNPLADTNSICDALNTNFVLDTSTKVSNNPTVEIMTALADKGAKTIKTPDGWEVQF